MVDLLRPHLHTVGEPHPGGEQESGASVPNSSSFQHYNTSDSEPSSIGNIGMSKPSRFRPTGVKRQKADDSVEAGAYKMAKSIDRVSRAIEESTKAKLVDSALAIQFKIVKSLPISGEEKEVRMKKLLLKASTLDSIDSNKRATVVEADGKETASPPKETETPLVTE